MTMRDKVTRFKIASREALPYMAHRVYGMPTHERPGIKTMAVDSSGRMYYDPAFVEKIDVPFGMFVVLHEALHVVLGHARMAARVLGPNPTPAMLRRWNEACDMVVNQILVRYLGHIPDWFNPVLHTTRGLPPRLTVIEYYQLLTDKDEQEQEQRRKQQAQQRQQQDDEDEDDSYGDGYDEDTPDMEPGDNPEEDDDDSDSEDDADADPDSDDDEPAGEGHAEDDCDGLEEDSEGDGGGSDADPEPGSSDEDADEEGDGEAESGGSPSEDGDGVSGGDSEEGGDSPDQGGDEASELGGSGADGQPRDYELPPESGDEEREYALDKELAKAIEEYERSHPGSVPGELKDSLDVRFNPQPDPWDVLRTAVCRAIASPVGAIDYTLRRFSRRQQADGPRLRGVVRHTPNAVVILDTSGSMRLQSPSVLRDRALAVIERGVRRLTAVTVVCGDTHVRSREVVRSVKGMGITGGGGTNMDAVVEKVDQEMRPDAIIVVTDCETDWPKQKTRARLVVAAVKGSYDQFPVPAWATLVDVTKGGAK
jgi:predicted metal-dependent peptidase